MIIEKQLEQILQKEEYSSIDKAWKEVLIKQVGEHAIGIIAEEKSKTKEESLFYPYYTEIEKNIAKDCYIGNLNKGMVKTDFNVTKELTISFLKEVEIMLVQELKSQAEYQQIILIPNTMDKYAALMRSAGLLKTHFEIAEEDLATKPKLKM